MNTPSPAATDASLSRRFAIALSFPGEHRAFVENVANLLAATFGESRVLYDRFHDAELARPDLDVYLPSLYHTQADLLVIFLCPEYAAKRWCRLEWRHIRQLLATADSGRIMFVSFGNPGDLTAQGVLSGDGYIDILKMSEKDVAGKIRSRLGLSSSARPPRDGRVGQAVPEFQTAAQDMDVLTASVVTPSIEAVFDGITAKLQELLDTTDGGEFARLLMQVLLPKEMTRSAGPLRMAELLRMLRPDEMLERIAEWLPSGPKQAFNARAMGRFCVGLCTLAVNQDWVAQHRAADSGGPIPLPDDVLGIESNLHYILVLALQDALVDYDPIRLLAGEGSDDHEISFSPDVVAPDPTAKGAMDEMKRIVVATVDRKRPMSDVLRCDSDTLHHLFLMACAKMKSEARFHTPYYMTYQGRDDEAEFLRRIESVGLRRKEYGFLLRKTPGLHKIVIDLIHAMAGLRRICDRLRT